MGETIDISVLESKQIVEMFTVANEFCLFVEEHDNYQKDYCLNYLLRVLPLLYIKGSLVPEVEYNDDIENQRYVTEDTWEYVFNSVKLIFGEDNSYHYWDKDLKEPILSSVAENIADIYQDLKDVLFLFSKNSHYAKLNSIYFCKDLFATRWGIIIPKLISHIHGIVYAESIENEEELTNL